MSEAKPIDKMKFMMSPMWGRLPAPVFFLPMYILLLVAMLLGKTGYIMVTDAVHPMLPFPDVPAPPDWHYGLYYLLTYAVIFPMVFLGWATYYKFLKKHIKDRLGGSWIDLGIVAIMSVTVYWFVERIFGVNAMYNTALDFELFGTHFWTGDILLFLVVIPLFMGGFFLIYRMFTKEEDTQFLLLAIGTILLVMLFQDWFFFVSCPYKDIVFQHGTTVGVYFSEWVYLPFINMSIPTIYIYVFAVSQLFIWLSTLRFYNFKTYIAFGLIPIICLILGTMLGSALV